MIKYSIPFSYKNLRMREEEKNGRREKNAGIYVIDKRKEGWKEEEKEMKGKKKEND